MFKGVSTNQAYETCISVGLCEGHMRELKNEYELKDPLDVQRRSFLYIRLRILDPILFGRPYLFEKMKRLLSNPKYFSTDNNTFGNLTGDDTMLDLILLLDSIVVFTLCQLCKICCSGCLFKNHFRLQQKLNPEDEFIKKLLYTKDLTESDIGHFNPILQNNFSGFDKDFIKFCYVIALLFVRNTTLRVRLKQALTDLSEDLCRFEGESNDWLSKVEEAEMNRNYEEALAAYKSVFKKNPYCTIGLSNRSRMYIAMNQYKKAELDSYLSVTIDPKHVQGYYLLSQALWHQSLLQECKLVVKLALLKCDVDNSNGYLSLLEMEKQVENMLNNKDNLEYYSDAEKSNTEEGKNEEEIPELEDSSNSDTDCEEPPPLSDASDSGKSTPESPLISKALDPVNPMSEIPDLEDSSGSDIDYEDIPNLEDSSSSDTDYEEPPPLSEASDSGNSTPDIPEVSEPAKASTTLAQLLKEKSIKENRKAVQKSSKPVKQKHKKSLPKACKPVKSKPEEKKIRFVDKDQIMNEGFETILDKNHNYAIEHITYLLDFIKAHVVKGSGIFSTTDVICQKYALGVAHYLSDSYESMKSCINIFQDIVDKNTEIAFPAVYYGLGLALYKHKRFKEALKYLKIVIHMPDKGLYCETFLWPDLNGVIKATTHDQLKNLTESMIKECESAPPPDAICRFEDCDACPDIYYDAPDFKGLETVRCSECCTLHYHTQCWKSLKTAKNLTDKEFLEKMCLTPDCEGTIMKVEVMNKNGTIEKEFGAAPQKKTVKQKKPKTPKKADIKEDKKKKWNKTKEVEMHKQRSTSECSDKNEMSSIIHSEQLSNGNISTEKLDEKPSPNVSLSVNAKPFIVLKKEKVLDENYYKSFSKQKEHKKAKGRPLNFEFPHHSKSFDETNNEENECHIEETKNIQSDEAYEEKYPALPSNNHCNYEPPTLQASSFVQFTDDLDNENTALFTNHCKDFQDDLGEINDSDAIISNIYKYMEDFLIKNGPLSIKDTRLIAELQSFPIEANIILAKFGGIAEFLKNDNEHRFAIVDNLFICSSEDLAEAYKLSRSSGLMGNSNNRLLEDYHLKPQHLKDNEIAEISPLNPDAKEYTPPSSSSSTSVNSFVSAPGDSSESKLEKTKHNSPLLMSAICKLRQPLTVDNHSTLNNVDEDPFSASMNSKQMLFQSPSKNFPNNVSTIDKSVQTIASIPEKISKSIQTDEVIKMSKETMKTDEEIQKLVDVIDALSKERRQMVLQKKLLENKLNNEMESTTKLQKLTTDEIDGLKEELKDSKLLVEIQKEEFQMKENKLRSENKDLVESLNKLTDKNEKQNKEISLLRVNNDSLMDSMAKFEISLECSREENKLLKKSLDQETEKNADTLKQFTDEKLQLIQQAKIAKVQLLKFKKQVFMQKVEAQTREAANQMEDINKFLQFANTNLELYGVYKANMIALKQQIQIHISKLAKIRLDFEVKIEEQIYIINNNVTSEPLPLIELGELPEIPRYTAPSGMPYNFGNSQMSPWGYSMFNSMFANCQMAQTANIDLNQPAMSQPNIVLPNPKAKLTDVVPKPSATSQPNIVLQTPNTVDVIPQPNTASDVAASKPPPGIGEGTLKNQLDPEATGAKPKKVKKVNSSAMSTEVMQDKESVIQNKLSKASPAKSLKMNDVGPASESSSSSSKSIDKNCDKSLELGYSKNSESSSSNTSLSSIQSANKSSTSSLRLLQKLKSKHPKYDESEIITFMKEVRNKRPRGFSGLAMNECVEKVSAYIVSQEKPNLTLKAGPVNKDRAIPPKILVNKSLVTEIKVKEEAQSQKVCPWGPSKNNGSKSSWKGNALEEDCIICYEQLDVASAYKVDCGHIFHSKCIREWLNKKSDCPICRVHLLLPEDYPALK